MLLNVALKPTVVLKETKDGVGFDGCCVCAELDCGSSDEGFVG